MTFATTILIFVGLGLAGIGLLVNMFERGRLERRVAKLEGSSQRRRPSMGRRTSPRVERFRDLAAPSRR